MTRAFVENKPMLAFTAEFGPVFQGDTYCVKHRELLTLGVEWDENGNQLETCAYCEWGDD